MDAFKLKSSSHLFKKFVMELDEVLSKTQTHTVNGSQVSEKDEHFKEQRAKLAAVKVDIPMAPVYPINEWLAEDIIRDEIETKTYEQDKEKGW
tara:strand:+ start:145 stop:423 length:279 start_codon:yes stop_codon:yes gene_type:complete